jgi:pyruvate, water dikinase
MTAPWIVPLDDPAAAEVALVGGKGAGLHRLVALGTRVPAGFVVTTAAFAAAVAAPEDIEAPLRALPDDAPVNAVEEATAQARALLTDAVRTAAARGDVPVLDAVRAAYRELGEAPLAESAAIGGAAVAGGASQAARTPGADASAGGNGDAVVADARAGEGDAAVGADARAGEGDAAVGADPRAGEGGGGVVADARLDEGAARGDAVGVGEPPVAVRSSAAAEDAADASYAGEHDSYLDVVGADAVADAVVACWASLYTARAVAYRRGRPAGAMAVVVQRMVAARAAGVFMTLNPANGDRATFVCEAVWGLGEPLVSGTVTPDRFAVNKISGEVVRREITHKSTRLGRSGIEPVPEAEQDAPCLTDDQLTELLRIGRAVETAAGSPQDGEFAVDHEGVHLLQARPETVWSRRPRAVARGRTALEAVLATLTGGHDAR